MTQSKYGQQSLVQKCTSQAKADWSAVYCWRSFSFKLRSKTNSTAYACLRPVSALWPWTGSSLLCSLYIIYQLMYCSLQC